MITEFNGYFNRGDVETVPQDHFIEVNNVKYGEAEVSTRNGIDEYNSPTSIGLDNVLRVHPFTMQSQQSQLVLTSGGHLHHVMSSTVIHNDILVIATMTDFNCVSFAGRAYITPFFTNAAGQEIGIQNEFLYVYTGIAPFLARKAAGAKSVSATPLISTFGSAGFSDLGFHIFAVIGETDTGYLTPPGPITFATATSTDTTKGYTITNIPIFPGTTIVKRHIVASKAVINYNGNQEGYQLFFVPLATLNDNVTTSIAISFYDIDLLEDASHLIENFSDIPAGVGLTLYHNRLVLTTTFTDISIAYVSAPGEPEAIDQVDGILIVPLDGNPLTNAQEYRDVLYLFKKTRTIGYSDNRDVPSSWQFFIVDEGVGAPVHGIATVLDSGGVNVDFLLVADFSGVFLFNGAYTRPELSSKIRNFWLALDRTLFRRIELINDSISQIAYCVLPNNTILMGDYSNGINPQDIRWSKWTFDIPITTMELINTNTILLGASLSGTNYSGIYKVVPGKTSDTLYNTSNTVTIFKIPNPLARFAFVTTSEDDRVVHFGSVRMRVSGVGDLEMRTIGLEEVHTLQLVPIVMTTAQFTIPHRLFNFQEHKMSLEVKTSVLNKIFAISSVIIYAKDVFSETPNRS